MRSADRAATTAPTYAATRCCSAAAELIGERGFGETRIADVAKRVGASPALVIYYFGTKDRLLTEALRYSEELVLRTAAEQLLGEHDRRPRAARARWSS